MKLFVYKCKCLLILSILFLQSCGYVKDKPPADVEVYKATEFSTCSVDPDKLSDIFKENQEAQIRCLEENFLQYTKYVKNKNNDAISESELTNFIKQIFKTQSDTIVNALSIIFQLNMILLRDEGQKISKGNIGPLFNLLVAVNRDAIIMTKLLQEMADKPNAQKFFSIRTRFIEAVRRFSQDSSMILNTKEGKDNILNLRTFLKEAINKLGQKKLVINMSEEDVDNIVFLKKLLLGGDYENVTSDELRVLVKNLPAILILSFDIYYAKSEYFETKSQASKFFLDDLRSLNRIIKFNQPNYNIVSVEQILKLAKHFQNKDQNIDFMKFKPSIEALKFRLLRGQPSNVSLEDVRRFVHLIVSGAEKVYFDTATYLARKDLIEGTIGPINSSDLVPIFPPEYADFRDRGNRLVDLSREFEDIILNYKYFPDKDTDLSYYGIPFKRNLFGVVETSLFQYAIGKVLDGYSPPRDGRPQADQEDFEKFLLDLKPILEELKLWSANFKTFSRNTLLLADLFQHQSDGNLLLNKIELTEYLQMVLAAIRLGDALKSNLKKVCPVNENTSIELKKQKLDPAEYLDTRCFNEHFFETFLNKLDFQKNFPRLKDYVVTNNNPDEAKTYLLGIEAFARDDSSLDTPIGARDLTLVLGALINIETTFIRFDTNKDNLLDYDELMNSLKVYRYSILKLLGTGQEEYADSIFLYMVTRMEKPKVDSIWQKLNFYSFHKCVHLKSCREKANGPVEVPIVAQRLNIGALLAYLVEKGVNVKKR